MYRLVVLTIVILGCSAQYGPAIKTALPAAPLPLAPLPVAPVLVQSAPVSYAAPQQHYGPIDAAVQTRRTIELRQVALNQDLAQPQVIEVPANYESVVIHFKTASSALNVRQSHIAAPVAPVEHTSFQDNAHRLIHEVVKPVIQEVREVIQPYRRVTQEIRPVIEEVHTLVHKGEKRAYQEPLPLKLVAPAYGPGAAIVANAGYKAAKAA